MRIEAELGTFPSVYQKDFKWFENIIPSKQYKDFDPYTLPEKDQELFRKGDVITLLTAEEKDAMLKMMRDKVMKSVYQVSYNLETIQLFSGDPKKLYNPENDKLLTIPRELYKAKYPEFKTLPPIPTSRRVYSFCRPRDYYTELSEYQDKYSREGYMILKSEADKGHWRLAPKKIPEVPHRVPLCMQQINKDS